MNYDLLGKRALVCGASQGIGRAIAIELSRRGAAVTSVARSEEKLQETLRLVEEESPKNLLEDFNPCNDYLAVDLLEREKLSALVADAIEKNDGYEILICNTGGPKAGPLAEAADEDFIKGFEQHVLVNSLLLKTCLPFMKEKKYGRVINIISTSVKIPISNLGVSNTIRGAVASWAKTMANELGPEGVTVNNVLPGFTDTPRLEALIKAASRRLGKTEEEVIKMWKVSVPMRRFGRPEETAQAVAFLASPQANYISGVNLPVDGGRTGCL